MRDEGIGSWPARRARMTPDRVALVHDGRASTYADIAARTARLAHALRAIGVGPGDRVGYLGHNHPTLAETLFASGALGAIFVPLNTRLAVPEWAAQLDDAEPRVLVWAPPFAEAIAALRDLVGVREYVALGTGDHADDENGDRTSDHARTAAVAGSRSYDELMSIGTDVDARSSPADAMFATVSIEDVGLDDTCMVQYTSGTTGRPKGVLLSHANITWNCYNMLLDVDVSSDEVSLVSAPMFHTAALNQLFLPTFLKGGRSVLMSSFDPESAFDLIAEHRVSWMFGVPTMFHAMSQSPRWADADLSSVRILMCGGAPVPESLIRTYQDRGLLFLQGYGLTETAPGALFLRAAESTRKVGSAGTPCFFTDVRVAKLEPAATTAPAGVAVGEPGEVLVRGPNVTSGYWRQPDATAAAFVDGWLRTGDIAIVDDDGYVSVVDRLKDMFITGGENVYPVEVEKCIHEHAAVADCAVIGVPDERWGEVGRAIVALRPGHAATGEEILSTLQGKLAKYKIPKSVVVVEAIPRNATGKLLRARLRESLGEA